MARYIGRRLLVIVPQLVIITVLVFFLIRLLPADPVARLVGLLATPEAYAQAESSLGLDKSVWSQFGTFVGGVVRLDFGVSWVSRDSVFGEVRSRAPITIQLIVLSFFFALLIAVPLGLVTAVRPGGFLDRAVFVYGLFAGAQPEFWWGLMFVFLFVFQLGFFPTPTGISDPEAVALSSITGFNLIDSLLHGNVQAFSAIFFYYLLPSLTLAFVLTGPIVKMVRQNVNDVLESDYVLFANAMGLKRRTVVLYALRNSLAPVITLVGVLFGFELGGAVLIEQIFSLNGLGQYAVQRTLSLDYPAIQAVVLTMTAFGLLVYLAMDVLYAALDPRIRY